MICQSQLKKLLLNYLSRFEVPMSHMVIMISLYGWVPFSHPSDLANKVATVNWHRINVHTITWWTVKWVNGVFNLGCLQWWFWLMFFKCLIRFLWFIKRKHQTQKQVTTKITISIIHIYHGRSKEPSHWNTSFECLKHNFTIEEKQPNLGLDA